jgi:hypothetical protein
MHMKLDITADTGHTYTVETERRGDTYYVVRAYHTTGRTMLDWHFIGCDDDYESSEQALIEGMAAVARAHHANTTAD